MLAKKKHYLQIALNSTLFEAGNIISKLPVSDRILLEAGTPLIKEFGARGIRQIYNWWRSKLFSSNIPAYIVADLKAMDRGEREVRIAKEAGASAAVVLGYAPVETIDSFIENCEKFGLDSIIDMMNADKPYKILRKLKMLPKVIILHRGVDEEQFSDKPLPIHLINKIKGVFNIMISIAGGDTPREIQSAVFNGADIVVLWKDFYRYSNRAESVVKKFLQTVK